jgi:hypothetical protein
MALGWVPRGGRPPSSDLPRGRRGNHRSASTVHRLHATHVTKETVLSISKRAPPRLQGPHRPHLAEAAASGAQVPTGMSAGQLRPDPRLLRQEQDAAGAPTSRPHYHQQIPRGVPPPITTRGAESPNPRRPLPQRLGLRPAAPPGATKRGDRGGEEPAATA